LFALFALNKLHFLSLQRPNIYLSRFKCKICWRFYDTLVDFNSFHCLLFWMSKIFLNYSVDLFQAQFNLCRDTTRVTVVFWIFLYYHETDANLTVRGMITHQYTVDITSKAISLSRCSDTFWIANFISGEMSRTNHLATSPTLLYAHLYSFTFFHLSCIFRHFFYDRCLCHACYYDCTSALLPLLSLSLSLSLSDSVSPLTHTRLNACTCIQNGWRVTRCLPVIRMNHRVAEKALGGLGLRISAFLTPSQERRVLYNTRACRVQANRRAYSWRENEGYFSRSRRLLVADGNYSSATSRKIQGHDYLVSRVATYDA